MKIDSNGFLFRDWNDWSSYIGKAIVGAVTCLFSTFYALVMGLVSLVVYAYKQVNRIITMYPVPTLCLFCIFLAFFSLFIFVNYSSRIDEYQTKLDSLSKENAKLERAFANDTIVIRYDARKMKRGLTE